MVLVGRSVKDPEVKEKEKGKKVSYITIAIPRSFKNMDGEYETDFINCILWDLVAKNTADYCKKGDIIGIKGRIETSKEEKENEPNRYYTNVIAEKVTFLSSKSQEEE